MGLVIKVFVVFKETPNNLRLLYRGKQRFMGTKVLQAVNLAHEAFKLLLTCHLYTSSRMHSAS